MQVDSRLILWLSSMLILGIGILLGMFIARRTGKKNAHIQELEEQLAQSKKEIEEYRAQVNEHFMKTSELVDQMTASYRAIFMHLAHGAQALSGGPHDASLKLPENDFLAHIRPPDQGMEESASIPEAGKEEVTAGAGEKTEPEEPGQKVTSVAEEQAAMAEESVTEEFEETGPRDEKRTEKREQRATDVEAGAKDEST